MPDFGRIPKGERFGLVPAFALALPDLKPGPKALYASLCTNANEKGHMWRSWNRLAKEFNVSRRQIQRWFFDLEAAGLVTRIGWHGRSPRLMAVRDPKGRDSIRLANLKNVIGRRAEFAEHGKEGARRRWKEGATSETPKSDASVPKVETRMSPKHNLPNKPPLTKEVARQERVPGAVVPPQQRSYGLKRLNESAETMAVRAALRELADKVGWATILQLNPQELTAELLEGASCTFSEHHVKAALLFPDAANVP